MGFDLYGQRSFNPPPPERPDFENCSKKEEKKYFKAITKYKKETPGFYFRNNVWWWRPLWDYVYSIASDVLTEEDYEYGQHNDYWLINKEKCIKLARIISEAISEGHPKEFEKKYTKMLEATPNEDCDLCNASGIRNDTHTDFKDKKCNKCGGKGIVRPFETSYPFKADNVIQFSIFVRNSGGFRIG